MDLGLQGRVALVTGGSRGIGRGIAAALAAEGATVAITSRDADAARAAADEIGAHGYAFDSADLDAIEPLIDAVTRDHGPVDAYVANTGGPPAGDPLGFSVAQWEAAHRTLVISPMRFCELLLPGMRERGWGRIVAVSSSAVREPAAHLQLSNANRPGLLAGLKVLSRQVIADGVTINAVLPGRIGTDRILANYGKGGAQRAVEDIPAGRLGTIEEIGAVGAFLCSEPARYVTGAWVPVDGGMLTSW
jgi:3-oxoacyl-[acyl-carrier protein] reductase